jgi:hypothetical protein
MFETKELAIVKNVHGGKVNHSLVARAQKSLDFQCPPFPMPLVKYVARLKTITYRAISTTGTLVVRNWFVM